MSLPLIELAIACSSGEIKHDDRKTRRRELSTELPQAGGSLDPGMEHDGFLGYSYFFSNATPLVCIFYENIFFQTGITYNYIMYIIRTH